MGNEKLRFALPALGDLPLAAIKSPDILAVIKPLIDDMKLETAHRVHAEISRTYNYAIAHYYSGPRNPDSSLSYILIQKRDRKLVKANARYLQEPKKQRLP